MSFKDFSFDSNPVLISLRMRNFTPHKMEKKFEDFIENKPLKIIDEEEIKAINSEMYENNLSKTLQNHNIIIDYTQNDLNKLEYFVLNFHQIPEEIFAHVLNVSLLICAEVEQEALTLPHYTVITLLTKLLKSQFSNTAENMFYYMLLTLVNNYKGLTFSDMFPYIQDFVSDVPLINPLLITVLLKWVKVIQKGSTRITDKNTTEIIFYVASLLENYEYLRGNEILSKVTAFTIAFISDLDPIALNFFVRIASFLPDDGGNAFFGILPNSLVSTLEEKEGFLLFDFSCIKEKEAAKITTTDKYTSDFPPQELFKNGTKIEVPNLPTPKTFKSICPRDIAILIDLISKAAMKINESSVVISASFQTAISKYSNSNHLCEIIIAFIALSKTLPPEDEILPAIFSLPFVTNVFSEKITVFNEVKEFENVHTARCFTIESIMRVPQVIPIILLKYTKFPLLETELLLYVIRALPRIDAQFLTSHNFVQCISQMIGLYTNAIYLNDHREESEQTLLVLFMLIKEIRKNRDIISVWMKNQLFMANFMSLIPERHLREEVLETLKENWVFNCKEISNFEIPFILNIIGKCKTSPCEEAQDTLNDIMVLLSDMTKINPEIMPYLKSVYDSACICTRSLPNNEKGKKVLHTVMNFFACMTDTYIMNATSREALAASIKEIEGPEPSEGLFIALVSLIAGKEMISLSSNFIIKQPHIVSIMIDAYLQSKQGTSVFKFLAKVCTFSHVNAILCHQGGVDTKILEFVDSCKAKDSDPTNIISSAFPVLIKIASVVSSTPVVHRFISLLCPIEGRYISKMHAIFLETMANIINSKRRVPAAFLPTEPDSPVIQVDDINGAELTQGFTFAIWFFIDKTISGDHHIFTISNNQNYIIVYLKGTKFQILTSVMGSAASFQCSAEITDDVWHLFALTVSHDVTNNRWLISPSINGSPTTQGASAMIGLDKNMISVTVGRKESDGNGLLLLGPFGLLEPVASNKILTGFSKQGPRAIPQNEVKQ